MNENKVREAISEHNAKYLDLRFTDILGKEQHITIPVSAIDEDFLKDGKMFDGSSIRGMQPIDQSDLTLIPDLSTLQHDPFYQESTLFLVCDVSDPMGKSEYARCSRTLAKRAEAYLQSTGIADKAFFGPEPEFFIFDDVRYHTSMCGSFYKIDAEEGHWNSGKKVDGGNIGHRPKIKGGYFPMPPVDSLHDIRAAICSTLERLRLKVEVHHHEVATGGQCEIGTGFQSVTAKADELQILKYVVHCVAHMYGKTATFMPKPLVGDNGNGMHCHQSLMKDEVNLFAGDAYAGLSETGLYYIGGIMKHAKALNAFTNSATNSYKRLVPGFEAPILLTYSLRNRSAAIRIPHVPNPKGRRIEVRFPDCMSNPYLAFSAMMMAGLDGIQNKIHPGEPMEKDLFALPPQEVMDIQTISTSLEQSIEHLRKDCEFLLRDQVFSMDLIEAYVALKEADIRHIRSLTHPGEFELYYSA
jgi:glutamine synthetase